MWRKENQQRGKADMWLGRDEGGVRGEEDHGRGTDPQNS